MNTLAKELPLKALNQALTKGTPQYHHSDRGSQYCSKAYIAVLREHSIQPSMSRKATPTDNPFAESFFRTLKVEEVNMFEYETMEHAKARITEFIDTVYTKKRLHSSLGYMPPEEFEAQWIKENNHKPKGRPKLQIPIQKTEKNSVFAVS